MTLALRLIPAIVMVLAGASPVFAQDIDRLLGLPLNAIELRVEGRPETSPALLALIDIKPGDRLSAEAWRRVAQRFDAVPRFDGVSINVEEPAEGLTLVFDVMPKHPVTSLRVVPSEATGLSPSDLESRIRDEFNGVPALTRTVEVEDAVKRILEDEGFRSPDARANIVRLHDPDRSTMEVSVTAGPRTTVVNAVIRGQSPLDPARTLIRLGVTPGAPFRERALEATLAEIRDELRAKQYYAAIAQQQRPDFTADGSGVSLVITINAGPVVVVNVKGELPGRFDDYIPIKVENSVDRDLLLESVDRITAGWRRKGYWRAKASYTTEEPTPDRLEITFTIDRGLRFRVLRVDVPKDDPLIVPSDFDGLKPLRPRELFDQSAVYDALSVVRRRFQDRGYHRVTMKPEFDEVPPQDGSDGWVIIRPNIVKGPHAIVTKIAFDLGERPKVAEAELRDLMQSKEGAQFSVGSLQNDGRALPALYDNRGFLERQIKIDPKANTLGTEVAIVVYVREGPQILVSEILVVGNEKVSVETIRREVTLQVGAPYSEAASLASQRALYDLGSFRFVRVSLDQWLPGETAARVVVAVEEQSTKTYEIGGGVEAGSYPRTLPEGGVEDRIIFAPRVSLGFARTNIGGHNRTLTAFGRLSLKPSTTDQDAIGSPDYRVITTFRERYAFGLKSDLLLSATAEQGLRTSYNFIKRATSAEFLRPLSPRVNASGRYTLEWSKRFDDAIPPDEQLAVDRLYPQVRISMFSGGISWDRRDDPLQTTRGGLLAFNTDVALKALGSEVGFIKSFAEATFFRPLIGPRRLILAVRGDLGLARGFDPNTTLENEFDDPLRDLPASQRLFSGGSSTHRAFQLDRLGANDVLTPDGQIQTKGVMTPDGLSLGGNGLVLFNAEVRALAGKLLNRELTVVGFVDVGNVFHRVSEIDLSQLRTGYGFGIRYDSWIGPLRLDFGFKTDRRTYTGGLERRWEFHLSIGEVF